MKIIIYINTVLILIALNVGCKNAGVEQSDGKTERNKEAREDSMKLASAYQLQSRIKHRVYPSVETAPMQEDPTEDAADDPAIWYNPNYPDSSLVFGTNKKSGVHSYDLNGNEVAFYPFGKVNNIDTRQNVVVGDDTLDILGGSNRTDNSIILYQINERGKLIPLLPGNHQIDTTVIDEVYGFCLYKNKDSVPFAIVNGKNGAIHQYQVKQNAEKNFYLDLINSWSLNSQPEGMVADDELDILYAGEEENGIWRISLQNPQLDPAMIPGSQQKNNPHIEYDIEGLSIYYGQGGNGFLMASIQGSFSYALFDRQTNIYLGSFTIGESNGIDGVEETDGLDIYSTSFGSQFPDGIVVVQDGFNFDEEVMVGQNFKFISLKEVTGLFSGTVEKEM